MGLKTKIPKDFKPSEPAFVKRDHKPDVQYWVGIKDGTTKKYSKATQDEVYDWVKLLFKKIPIEDGYKLGLMTAKASLIDVSLSVAISQYRNLFGGPEFWESLDDWQRAGKIKGKEKKKNK